MNSYHVVIFHRVEFFKSLQFLQLFDSNSRKREKWSLLHLDFHIFFLIDSGESMRWCTAAATATLS